MDHTDYEITLIRSRRKSLAIEITPELQVVVRAPARMPVREINAFVQEKDDWIRAHLQQMAEKMDMSTSTVSRAIQNKYIQYRGRIVPLRSFFTTAIRSDASVSSQAVRQRIQDLIKTENPEAPLSDESVRIALSALGIEVSRRAVAKYRMALDIPPSSQRKKR